MSVWRVKEVPQSSGGRCLKRGQMGYGKGQCYVQSKTKARKKVKKVEVPWGQNFVFSFLSLVLASQQQLLSR